MSVAAGKLFLAAGLGLIVFSGYQAMSYRETLRLTQEEFQGLPLSIAALLVAAAALSLVGALQSSGELQPISLADNPQPLVFRPHQIDFVTFSHRGPLLAALQRKGGGAPQPAASVG